MKFWRLSVCPFSENRQLKPPITVVSPTVGKRTASSQTTRRHTAQYNAIQNHSTSKRSNYFCCNSRVMFSCKSLFTALVLFSSALVASSSPVSSRWALAIGSRVEETILARNKRSGAVEKMPFADPSCRGGATVAAVKTMTARQMEAFKYVFDVSACGLFDENFHRRVSFLTSCMNLIVVETASFRVE